MTHEVLLRMIEDTIRSYHTESVSTFTGKLIPPRSEPLDHILVTLSPDLMRACAKREFHVPREVMGFEVRISEAPSVAHSYYPCYLVHVQSVCLRDGKHHKGRGRVTLERVLTPEEDQQAREQKILGNKGWWQL